MRVWRCGSSLPLPAACADEGTVRELSELRLSPEDFEVQSVIGQGHFGEVREATCAHGHTEIHTVPHAFLYEMYMYR